MLGVCIRVLPWRNLVLLLDPAGLGELDLDPGDLRPPGGDGDRLCELILESVLVFFVMRGIFAANLKTIQLKLDLSNAAL